MPWGFFIRLLITLSFAAVFFTATLFQSEPAPTLKQLNELTINALPITKDNKNKLRFVSKLSFSKLDAEYAGIFRIFADKAQAEETLFNLLKSDNLKKLDTLIDKGLNIWKTKCHDLNINHKRLAEILEVYRINSADFNCLRQEIYVYWEKLRKDGNECWLDCRNFISDRIIEYRFIQCLAINPKKPHCCYEKALKFTSRLYLPDIKAADLNEKSELRSCKYEANNPDFFILQNKSVSCGIPDEYNTKNHRHIATNPNDKSKDPYTQVDFDNIKGMEKKCMEKQALIKKDDTDIKYKFEFIGIDGIFLSLSIVLSYLIFIIFHIRD